MWDEKQAENVRGLLTQFNGEEEVCAVMGCQPSNLDALCRHSFGLDFEEAKAHFSAQGRAMVRKTLMQQALDGNMKALDMLARAELGMGAVETRRRNAAADDAKTEEETDDDGGFLRTIQGRREDRLAKAQGES